MRITGRPHRENYGARFAAVAVFWPAELATAPHELTRAGRTAP